VNLAGLYAKQGKKVLIVDADQQGNIYINVNADVYNNMLYHNNSINIKRFLHENIKKQENT
ncbi:ParA family protein, partial [Bacillus sp. B-TM1]